MIWISIARTVCPGSPLDWTRGWDNVEVGLYRQHILVETDRQRHTGLSRRLSPRSEASTQSHRGEGCCWSRFCSHPTFPFLLRTWICKVVLGLSVLDCILIVYSATIYQPDRGDTTRCSALIYQKGTSAPWASCIQSWHGCSWMFTGQLFCDESLEHNSHQKE